MIKFLFLNIKMIAKATSYHVLPSLYNNSKCSLKELTFVDKELNKLQLSFGDYLTKNDQVSLQILLLFAIHIYDF